MPFRLKALGLHLLLSIVLLTLVFGTFYLLWYRWPGWPLSGVATIIPIIVIVDVALGPTLTGVIASPTKPKRVLARDISIIGVLQLIALGYGAVSLWRGRPLYYAFSANMLQLVQSYDISAQERELGQQLNPTLTPHWYSRPRWIWAPLPADPAEAQRIIEASITGGTDVIGMPRYFKPWQQGLPELRQQLKPVGQSKFFGTAQKRALAQTMRAAGLSPEAASSIPFTGRGPNMLAVFDPTHLTLQGVFRAP